MLVDNAYATLCILTHYGTRRAIGSHSSLYKKVDMISCVKFFSTNIFHTARLHKEFSLFFCELGPLANHWQDSFPQHLKHIEGLYRSIPTQGHSWRTCCDHTH